MRENLQTFDLAEIVKVLIPDGSHPTGRQRGGPAICEKLENGGKCHAAVQHGMLRFLD